MTADSNFDAAQAARAALLARMLSGQASAPGAAQTAAPAPIARRDPAARVPLTAEQSQLWLHAQMAPDMPLYNESITIHRHGPYNHAALEQALSEIVRRHEIWRTGFADIDGELVQQVKPAGPITLSLVDLSMLPAAQRDSEAIRLATEDTRRPVSFDSDLLFRARVMKIATDEHRLYLTLHHIIFDGVSIYRTLVPELAALVAAFEAGEPSPLPEPALQYGDYAVWQAARTDAPERTRQLDFWRERLAGPLPRLELAGDRARPAIPTHAGSMEVFELPGSLVERLKDLARREGATLYMVLLAAYKTMLFRYTGENDVIVGGVTDTRRRPELQSLIGYFLNTMALRTQPDGNLPFAVYLAQVKASVIGALGASDIPFDRMIHALGIRRSASTHPLFNTLFSIEPPVAPFPDGWDLTQMDVTVGAAKYDIYLELDERHDGMAGRFLYSTELFDRATIHRMIGHWTRILEGIVADPHCALARLPMLGDDERTMLADTWNDTTRALPFGNVVDWFANRVAAQPHGAAIVQHGVTWTYRDLAHRSDAIAAMLVAQGVTPGSLIGLSLARTPLMVAAMLGVLKAGGAYLPLDPAFPLARLIQIADDAQPALVLVDAGLVHPLAQAPVRLVEVHDDLPAAGFVAPPIADHALAYVLYTSGSTGQPKGVEIPHDALANLLAAMAAEPGFGQGDTLLALTTLSFDIAGLELWLPLVCGGTVILATREQAVDMVALASLVDSARPDVVQATPATWRGLLESGWKGAPWLRALCGGEALPRTLADELRPKVGELWNMYGPTETTIWSTVAQVDGQPGAVPIGRPIANTQVRILDRDGNDCPIGGIGELCIGGKGVARGYRGRDDLTHARFITHAGARLYRTGDLARWRSDGSLECLGRNDSEEKIRGFRIAIEEVESALASLPGVAAAAVRAWPDASGERALAGYVAGTQLAERTPAQWREALGVLLPEYMVPTRFVVLDALPMTPNGKVDRNALPEPGVATGRRANPPETPDEVRLAAIWSDVLGVEQVHRDDNFFDLGGHSLLIARLLRRIEAGYGIRLPMAALFRAQTLAQQADLIASGALVGSSLLVPIRPDGSRPPILWLDGGSTMRPLAGRLGKDQPFIGVHVDGVLEAEGHCPDKLEDTARLVVAALRKENVRGPWYLGGWCTGGILAYAVAAQLRDEGEDVALLMMAHAFHPPTVRKYSAARLFLSKLNFHIGKSLRQVKGQRLRYFRERLVGMSDAVGLVGGVEAVLQPKLRAALDRSAMQYTPPVYAGNTILFQPTEMPALLDFLADWAEVVTGPFAGHVVTGGHRTMLEAPYVDDLAGVLRPALARAGAASDQQAA